MPGGEPKDSLFGIYAANCVAHTWVPQPSVATFAGTETADIFTPVKQLIINLQDEVARLKDEAEERQAKLHSLAGTYNLQRETIEAQKAQLNEYKAECDHIQAQLWMQAEKHRDELNALHRAAFLPREADVTLNFTVEVNPGIDMSQISHDLAKYERLVARYG